jgi:spore coat polysaccharide biosynthesis protein SpsF (cytidylyltransferase family)
MGLMMKLSDLIEFFFDSCFDYVSNGDPPTYPDGLDVEVFKFSVLKQVWLEAKAQRDREHVTTYIRESGLFKVGNYENDTDFSEERWVVDYPEDYTLVKTIIEHFGSENGWFGLKEIMNYRKQNPDLFAINQHISRQD